jgi:hypothetical protein
MLLPGSRPPPAKPSADATQNDGSHAACSVEGTRRLVAAERDPPVPAQGLAPYHSTRTRADAGAKQNVCRPRGDLPPCRARKTALPPAGSCRALRRAGNVRHRKPQGLRAASYGWAVVDSNQWPLLANARGLAVLDGDVVLTAGPDLRPKGPSAWKLAWRAGPAVGRALGRDPGNAALSGV